MEEELLDFTKLKYVLYARKSTEDESRQIRSTGDQIAECRQLAARIGLTVVEPPIIEEKSAKSPNNGDLFGVFGDVFGDGPQTYCPNNPNKTLF